MSSSKESPDAEGFQTESRWPMLVVTGLLAMGTVLLVSPNELTSLAAFARRQKIILAHPADPSYREPYPSVAFYRRLDGTLPPDARVFFSGMIGPDKQLRLYYYFFARTYLFPREVEISLDRKAVYHNEVFDGVDSTSTDELRKNGFDVLLQVAKNGDISVTPLTQKGGLKP